MSIAVHDLNPAPPADVVVEVRASDVELGERHHAGACPVAHALRRTLGRDVRVTRVAWCYYESIADLLRHVGMRDLPPDVVAKVREFDVTGVFPMPCTFTVRP